MGNELNGPWHYYACDDAYFEKAKTSKVPDNRCAFGGDGTRLLRAIDEICSVATEYGRLCTTALADTILPDAMRVRDVM